MDGWYSVNITFKSVSTRSVCISLSIRLDYPGYPLNERHLHCRHSTSLSASMGPLSFEAEDPVNALVAGSHLDAEGHGRAARETVVLREVDRLLGQLLHVEGPEEAGDGEEDLLLGERDTRADTATAQDVSR